MKIAVYILIITLVMLNSKRTFAQLINEFDNIPFGNCLRKLDSNDLIKQKRLVPSHIHQILELKYPQNINKQIKHISLPIALTQEGLNYCNVKDMTRSTAIC